MLGFPMNTETEEERTKRLGHEAWCNSLPSTFGDLERDGVELFFLGSYAGYFPQDMPQTLSEAEKVAAKILADAQECDCWGD